ncbi:Putative two-component sensor histidine kinase (fragment), classical system [Magnetospirillum molischianum DSM 120]|uniref:histidine kinase n=2 Tax=Magnetospirillum molischianum TaxID=1083 RepID=H8FQU9_MAGML
MEERIRRLRQMSRANDDTVAEIDPISIILRTGKPGDIPDLDIVVGNDRGDYKRKAEPTARKQTTSLTGTLRAWHDIATIARLNADLSALNAELEQRVVERTRQLQDMVRALGRSKQQAETALAREREARRQLRQLLSMVSHEFRTPLAIIDSAAQMLEIRTGATDPGSLPRLGIIRGGVQRLLGLIDTCLADEQLDSGIMMMHEQSFDPAALIEVTLAQHRIAAPDHCFQIEAETNLAVWGDPGLIALALNNLIGNAVKYAPEGSEITVSTRRDGKSGDIVIAIADRGIGIPEEDLPGIFERFHRASNTQGVSGSGIGLHMVRQIVEMHGGTISVESRQGQGSRFTVRLHPPPSDQPTIF